LTKYHTGIKLFSIKFDSLLPHLPHPVSGTRALLQDMSFLIPFSLLFSSYRPTCSAQTGSPVTHNLPYLLDFTCLLD